MPLSPLASQLTARYRHQLAALSDLVSQQLTRRFRSADPADIDAWFDRIYPELEQLIVTGQRAANAATASYLVNHAAAQGLLIQPTLVTPTAEQIATSLRVTGPVAFKTSIRSTGSEVAASRVMIHTATGAGQRLILAAARDSVDATVRQAKVILGYQRVTSGRPCAFCAMLASRGAVYKTEASAGADQQFHDHCVVGSTSVQGPRTELAYRRWYEGELIIITTARGDELAVTPKHPVLTDRGWVDAGELRQSDRLVHGVDVESVPLGVPDEDQMPSLIEDVWRAHGMDGFTPMPVAAEDFHGDGVGTKGYVHVVSADGLLSEIAELLASQLYAEPIGPRAGSATVLSPLLAGSDLAHEGVRSALVAQSGVGWLGEDLALNRGAVSVARQAGLYRSPAFCTCSVEPFGDGWPGDTQSLGEGEHGLAFEVGLQGAGGNVGSVGARTLGPRSRFDPPLLEEQADGLRAKADLGARLLERLAGKVHLSSPVELRRVGGWSGHVFNLQTVEGWYSANNIVVSNCSCTVEPLYSRDSGPAPFAAEWQQAKQIASEQGIRSDVAFRRLVEGRSLPTP